MNHLPLWYLGQLNPELCDIAIKEFNLINPEEATMGVDAEYKNNQQRNTTLRFAPNEHWFGGIMYGHGMQANKHCDWGFDVRWHESVQYGEYGPSQHYNWHTDTFPLINHPHDRKITVICQMNDPSEYEGGELLLRLYGEHKPELKKGTLLAFPSQIEHKVCPVISGTRFSAVLWMNGPRIR